MKLKRTKKGKSYWAGNGAYQKEQDKLYKELVPDNGEAPTVHGEMIRAIGRLFYDFCNNGNCNAVETESETCPECDGSGYEEMATGCYDDDGEEEYEQEDCGYCGGECSIDGDKFVTEYYAKMLEVLRDNLPDSECVDELEAFMTDTEVGYGTYKFDGDEMGVYNKVCDIVIHHVLTTENEEREVTDNKPRIY